MAAVLVPLGDFAAGGVEDHLGDTVAVAQVDENAAAVVAARAYPAEQHDLRAYVSSS